MSCYLEFSESVLLSSCLQVVRLLTGMDLCAVAVQTTVDRLFPDERNLVVALGGGGADTQRQRAEEESSADASGVAAHNTAFDKVADDLNKKLVRDLLLSSHFRAREVTSRLYSTAPGHSSQARA